MARSDPPLLIERELSTRDLGAALRLSAAVQWNQTAADWTYLAAAGRAFGRFTDAGDLVATALALPYPAGFGWISMVIVDPAYRGRGVATQLMQRCIAELTSAARTPVLDATPAGRAVYAKLGFVSAWSFQRLRRSGVAAPLAAPAPPGVTIRALEDGDLANVAAFDRPAFGSTREPLLRALRARSPAAAWIAHSGRSVRGFCLGRDGRTAHHIGPVVAADAAVAAALIARALARVSGPLILDVPDVHALLGDALRGAGFVHERALTRMIYRSGYAFGDLAMTFAVAGPELG